MRLTCNGNHRLLRPIRPIALTFCDLLALTRQSKLLAAVFAGAVLVLLLSAHFAAALLGSQSFDLLYAMIKAYLSKRATGLVYQGVVHWAIGNGVFFAFRFCLYLILCGAYDVGAKVVFALSLLVGIGLVASFGVGLYSGTVWNGQIAACTLAFAAFLGWFWSRYMAGDTDLHRSFDIDVGAALVRLRPR